jgi:hypothetical protein
MLMGPRHGRRCRARCGSRVSVAASSEEVDDDGDKGRGAAFVSLFSTCGGGGGDVLCAAAVCWQQRPCGCGGVRVAGATASSSLPRSRGVAVAGSSPSSLRPGISASYPFPGGGAAVLVAATSAWWWCQWRWPRPAGRWRRVASGKEAAVAGGWL